MLFPTKKMFWILVSIVFILIAIYTFNTVWTWTLERDLAWEWVNAFHIDYESNIPSWFSSIILFSTAFTAYIIVRLKQNQPEKTSSDLIFWWVVVGVYVFFSADESAMLHELIDDLSNTKWVYIYAPVGAVFFAYCGYMLWIKRAVDRNIALWIIGGLIVFGAGGVVCEYIGFKLQPTYSIKQILYVFEESGEMMGTIMVLRGCLTYANQLFQKSKAPVSV